MLESIHKAPIIYNTQEYARSIPSYGWHSSNCYFPIKFPLTSLPMEDNTATFTCSYVRPP